MKKPQDIRFVNLNVVPEVRDLAEKLAEMLSREKGVPVRRPTAVEIAIREAIASRGRKAAKP